VDELVWFSKGGGRYHASQTCRAFIDGQRKAVAEGRQTHPARRVALSALEKPVGPCAVCWPETSEWDEWLRLEHETLRMSDSRFEYEFLHRVLKNVEGVDPAYVSVQHEIHSGVGRLYRIDFAILRPGRPRLAIEIDGYNKSPEGLDTKSQHDRWSARQNELVNAGWTPLRFTNRQVQTSAGDCRRQIEEALLRQEPISAATGGAGATDVHSMTSRAPGAGNWSHRRMGLLLAVVLVAVLAAVALLSWNTLRHSGPDSANPTGFSCPAGFPVKGNVSDSGEKIYHEPGWRYYKDTRPEECFVDEDAAESVGYRASEIR
jgi:very-short-patch-repair endonuclease